MSRASVQIHSKRAGTGNRPHLVLVADGEDPPIVVNGQRRGNAATAVTPGDAPRRSPATPSRPRVARVHAGAP